MLTSLALIFILGLMLGYIFNKLNLPSLIGMLLTGIILGPYVLNVLDSSILMISPDLRQLALVIILTRAGLSLNIHDLKKVGRPAILMCFVPALFEIVGVVLIAPTLLHISVIEALIIGSVIAAVSPAVIVPRMIKLMENGYGVDKSIPQLIMAGASVDDVFVIVLFTVFTSFAQGKGFQAVSLFEIPISIVLGILLGGIVGFLLSLFFNKFHMRDSVKVIFILSISCLILTLEKSLKGIVPISGLLAIMCIGIMILQKNEIVAKRISVKFSKLWVGAEILLFVLVGATVDIQYAVSAGVTALMVIFGAMLFRVIGVALCFMKTSLTLKERVFCMIAYLPKATVQAAIGSVPLAMGLPCGKIVLTIAVLAILVTAPIGAFGVDMTYKKLLTKRDCLEY